ncbi:hypothetical protein F511_23459 [Dorcoceras hygrometricum]|uniref:Uncharacterized protein n=1 Tax=Dorcoceras hygrometricum TaxID=472368 RepID=A0A2Z7BXG1_9LAMI|nr:hypothetical protein F511_23459 [Dorcoceras hygrometricum]
MYSQQPAVSSQHRFCTVSSQLSYDWSTQLWTVNSALTNENSDFDDENSDFAREFHWWQHFIKSGIKALMAALLTLITAPINTQLVAAFSLTHSENFSTISIRTKNRLKKKNKSCSGAGEDSAFLLLMNFCFRICSGVVSALVLSAALVLINSNLL